MLAQITVCDFLITPTSMDFGSCSTYESVMQTVTLTNTSILPHTFGFIDIPPYMDVQPGDGFGKLLPGESVEVDLIFSPEKSREYIFELCCKSGINK